MLRLYKDNIVSKYKNGKWVWDEQAEKFKFISSVVIDDSESVIPVAVQTSVVRFSNIMDNVEELIFRKIFERPSNSFDADVITIQDIKNLVLFLAPSKIMSKTFINFLHTKTVDKFLNALIIYFEYFLKVVEFLLIKRDELKNDKLRKLQSLESVENMKMLSEYLGQYRILIAREYSKIILGTHDMAPFHHIAPDINISNTRKDCKLHEAFLAFSAQSVWIAMHRRAFRVIDSEVNRLFRSIHFNMTDKGQKNSEYQQFSKIEEQVLYGRNDQRANFRNQISPIIQEISKITPKNLPILWIGEKKYRGTDKRILELEMEFVVPDSQLPLIDVSHGILGHTKKIYNTMLALDRDALRICKFNEKYDPFNLIRSPCLKLPRWESFTKIQKSYDSYFQLLDVRFEKDVIDIQKNNWKKRDRIVNGLKRRGLDDDVLLHCKNEIDSMNQEIIIERDRIITKFLEDKKKLMAK